MGRDGHLIAGRFQFSRRMNASASANESIRQPGRVNFASRNDSGSPQR
jgi:hypothetical protein